MCSLRPNAFYRVVQILYDYTQPRFSKINHLTLQDFRVITMPNPAFNAFELLNTMFGTMINMTHLCVQLSNF